MEVRNTQQTAIDSLYRISSLVSDTDEPKVALRLILDEIVSVLKPNSASISLINPDTQVLELEASIGLSHDWDDMELSLGQGITGWTALYGKSLIVPDVDSEPRYISVREGIRSEMAVPMEDRGAVIGVVNVDSETVDAFGQEDLKILTLLTNEATRVVSRLWLIKQLRTKANQLQSLVNVSRQLVGELEHEELLRGLSKHGLQLLDCESCALFLLKPNGYEIELHSMVNKAGSMELDMTIPLSDSAIGAAISRKKQIEVNDMSFTEENDFLTVCRKNGLVSMLVNPIIYQDEVIGVLNAYTSRPHRFNNDEKNTFATLAGIGGITIQNARLYARVFASEESLRSNDKLTTLGMLSAEIAHEIRNPLTVIKLLFDSLDLNFPVEDARYMDVSVIGEKLDQLEEIVERVLSFGRNKEGMYTRQNLNKLVEDTLTLVRLKLHQQKIQVHSIAGHDNVYVEVNKGQILQVMLNLVINATQAMPHGGTIWIETSRQKERVEMCIRDNGSGIPEDIQDKIFESFLTDRPDGTGLGLSISKRIMKGHRGDIKLLESSPSGTVFQIWLPAE